MVKTLNRQKPKKGRVFFLLLVILSGIAVFSLLFLAIEGDKVTIYTIEKFVLDRDLFESELDPDISVEEKRSILLKLRQFFESAKSGNESQERIALVGEKLREIMKDRRITRDETRELDALLNRDRPPSQ
jgi:hypothetical protein